jgi:hypothetical protein
MPRIEFGGCGVLQRPFSSVTVVDCRRAFGEAEQGICSVGEAFFLLQAVAVTLHSQRGDHVFCAIAVFSSRLHCCRIGSDNRLAPSTTSISTRRSPLNQPESC